MELYNTIINDPDLGKAERLAALRSGEAEISSDSSAENPGKVSADTVKKPSRNFNRSTSEINNHIHTIYSFSPYTPSMAALLARNAGLGAAGSVDHDSIAAAGEMVDACAVLGIGGCVGVELRVSFKNGSDGKPGPFASRKINSPDSEGYAYMTVQGIPSQSIGKMSEFLVPLRAERYKRTRAMTVSANALLKEAGLAEIDFNRDVVARSKYAEGGGITERHLLAAMADKLILKYGKGPDLAAGLASKMGVTVPPKLGALLSDPNNPHYLYDLLGILKAELLPGIYIQPDGNECIPAARVTAFADSIAAIPAYPYLGDVGDSPTGDKKGEKFEDDFIDELFAEITRLGYRAVAYMPPRNTMEQLRRIRKLSTEWGFMEISGVDINSSRQSFNCPEVLRDEFRHLLDTTWALIAHERLASVDVRYGLFSAKNPLASMALAERIAFYANLGKRLDLYHPDESAAVLSAEIDKGKI